MFSYIMDGTTSKLDATVNVVVTPKKPQFEAVNVGTDHVIITFKKSEGATGTVTGNKQKAPKGKLKSYRKIKNFKI